MNKELKQWLIDHYKGEGEKTLADEDLVECLTEEDTILSEDPSRSRWYTSFTDTIKVGEKYFQLPRYDIQGDNSMEDLCLTIELDEIIEVEKVEVLTTVYRAV